MIGGSNGSTPRAALPTTPKVCATAPRLATRLHPRQPLLLSRGERRVVRARHVGDRRAVGEPVDPDHNLSARLLGLLQLPGASGDRLLEIPSVDGRSRAAQRVDLLDQGAGLSSIRSVSDST